MIRWNRHHIEQKETIITLLCDQAYFPTAEHALKELRGILERQIRIDAVFRTSHRPVKRSLPVQLHPMMVASTLMDVGPMASVAGLFAETALKAVIKAGAEEAIVDNGGDIALAVKAPVVIGIYAGQSAMKNLAFKIESTASPLGICTSSGTVGHSFSYGRADAAVVISENIPLADAAATALGNRVHGRQDLKTCFDCLKSHKEIQGALVIFGDQIALWGQLPELIEMEVNPDLITRGATGS